MRTNAVLVAATSFTSLAAAAPFSYPLKDGFPSPNPAQLANIQKIAQGTLSNSSLPARIDQDTTTSFQLIAFNELFETAYFSSLLDNITAGVSGYEIPSKSYVDNLNAIRAQEELHALTANAVLGHFNKTQIQPCKYQFPVTDLVGAVALAQKFTDLVLGTLNDVQTNAVMSLGKDGAGYVNALAPVIGQEGQQSGWFRTQQKKIPSAQPFLTGAARAFAWSALQQFVVPGSCPNANAIDLPVFGQLNLLTKQVGDGPVTFETVPNYGQALNPQGQRLVYISGANKPIIVPFTVSKKNRVIAPFPLVHNELSGLTIAAVVTGEGPFANADDVAKAAVFGPGLIEVN